MEYVIWPLAILGFVAFCSMGSLTSRIKKLEQQLSSMEGTSAHAERLSLVKLLQEYVGKNVEIEFKDEENDMDIANAVMRKGTCTIRAADGDWVHVHITYGKVDKEKLIRVSEISGIKERNL